MQLCCGLWQVMTNYGLNGDLPKPCLQQGPRFEIRTEMSKGCAPEGKENEKYKKKRNIRCWRERKKNVLDAIFPSKGGQLLRFLFFLFFFFPGEHHVVNAIYSCILSAISRSVLSWRTIHSHNSGVPELSSYREKITQKKKPSYIYQEILSLFEAASVISSVHCIKSRRRSTLILRA